MRPLLLCLPWIICAFCMGRDPFSPTNLSRPTTPTAKEHHPQRKSHRGHHDRAIKLPAYAKAGLTLGSGVITQIEFEPSSSFYVVPLGINKETSKNIDFNSDNHAFEIHHSGLYMANFFLKLFANVSSGTQGSVVISLLKSTGGSRTFFSPTKLFASGAWDFGAPLQDLKGTTCFGTGQAFLHLSEGDHLQLTITSIAPGLMTPFYINDCQKGTDEVAYLTLIKIGS